jgi:hypothetical protein
MHSLTIDSVIIIELTMFHTLMPHVGMSRIDEMYVCMYIFAPYVVEILYNE